jgi:uncharacterized membrane protein YjfL (UPF0719 family)
MPKVADWEPFAGLVSSVVALITWAPWYSDIFRVNRLAAPRSYRLVLGLAPIACLLFLLLCLERSAAKAVRENGLYILIYMALGAAALGISGQLLSFLGLSARDDVLERRNSAALIAVVGALLGAILCFAGGNIGEGPGVEVVIVSAGTALCAWFVLWYLVDVLSGRVVSERITVDRDTGSGVRLAGLLAGNGVILGAAVAGDWIPGMFLHDFAVSAWPAIGLTVIAVLVEKFSQSRSSIIGSVLTISAYLLVAVVWVLNRGINA